MPRSKDAPAVIIGSVPDRAVGAGGGGGGAAARKSIGSASGAGAAKRKGASASAPGSDLAGIGGGDADMSGGGAADEGEQPDAPGGGKTLGERVSATAGANTKIASSTAADAMTATDKAVAEALGDGKGAPPKADSLATLLSQALVAEDRALVERCLNVSDQTTVSNTVARLQPAVAVRLLTAALDRMHTKPARGEQLARWMRTVMLHHAGFITSSGKAQAAIMELQQMVEAHVSMQRPLLTLLGRLDLLLHKQQQQQQHGGGVGSTAGGGKGGGGTGAGGRAGEGGDAGPLTMYTEGDDDVDVLDEVMGGGGGDDSDDDEEDDEEEDGDEWETDGDDDEDDDENKDDDDDDDDDDME